MSKALIFDLDDTLVSTRSAAQHALQALYQAGLNRLWTSPEDLHAEWDRGLTLFSAMPRGHDKDFFDLKRLRMRLIHRREDMSDDEADQKFALFYRHYADGFKAFEDVAAFFSRPSLPPIGLITNGASRIQREKLQRTGLAAYFQCIVISAEVEMEKPDPRIFRLAAEQIGRPIDQCHYIGDNVALDFEGSRAAGMQSTLISRYGMRPFSAGSQIQSLLELSQDPFHP